MLRVRTAVTGFLGAPGLMTNYFSAPVEDAANALVVSGRVRAALLNVAALFNTQVSLNVLPQVDVLDAVTGQITDSFITATPATLVGTGSSSLGLPPQVAVLVQWRTSVFQEGRRLVGRTFLSPLSSTVQGGFGTVNSGSVTSVNAYADAIIDEGGSGAFAVVWRRPRPARTTPLPAQSARVGMSAPITSRAVPTKFATLNSRRD